MTLVTMLICAEHRVSERTMLMHKHENERSLSSSRRHCIVVRWLHRCLRNFAVNGVGFALMLSSRWCPVSRVNGWGNALGKVGA